LTDFDEMMKFGKMMHIGPYSQSIAKNFEFLNIQNGGRRHNGKFKKIAISQQKLDRFSQNLAF